MAKLVLIHIFILLCCYSALGVNIKLEAFVGRLIGKYPTWLIKNYLDPSDVLSEPFLLEMQGSNSGLTIEISNIQIQGHSLHNLTLNSIEFFPPREFADWSEFKLDALIGGDETIITGDYKINGTLNENTVVRGSGNWTARPNSGAQFRMIMHYMLFDFESFNDVKHVGLKRAPVKFAECYFWGTREYTMDGLDAGGNEEQIKNTVLNNFFGQERFNRDLPLTAQFLAYIENAFEAAPYPSF